MKARPKLPPALFAELMDRFKSKNETANPENETEKPRAFFRYKKVAQQPLPDLPPYPSPLPAYGEAEESDLPSYPLPPPPCDEAEESNLPPYPLPPPPLFAIIDPGFLPPNDYPPLCPTDLDLMGEEGCKILWRLQKRLTEFDNAVKTLSYKVSQVVPQLECKLSNCGESLAQFVQQVMLSASAINKYNNPFPELSRLIEEKAEEKAQFTFSDIVFSFNSIQERIVNPELNFEYKERAIQCSLLTIAYGKLIQAPFDVNDIRNELISPMQQLIRAGLFGKDALNDFKSLLNCIKTSDPNKQVVDNTIVRLKELQCRSQQLALVVNHIKAIVDDVSAFLPEYKRYSDEAVILMNFTISSTKELVEFIMQKKIQDEEIFSKQINEKVQVEFKNCAHSTFIRPCDRLYADITKILNESKSNRKEAINLLKKNLKTIHENHSFNDDQKLTMLKREIKLISENLNESLRSSSYFYFYPTSSFLANDLSAFIKEMDNKYSDYSQFRMIFPE